MREVFASIYHGPGDPEVPPLRALARYQEFMDLTPAGPEGDRIIAGLADRLVGIALFDLAAELLKDQVRYRLQGADKGRIGARRARLQLLNRNHETSLAAVSGSAGESTDTAITATRKNHV